MYIWRRNNHVRECNYRHGNRDILAHYHRMLGSSTFQPTVSNCPGATNMRVCVNNWVILDNIGVPPWACIRGSMPTQHVTLYLYLSERMRIYRDAIIAIAEHFTYLRTGRSYLTCSHRSLFQGTFFR